MSNLDDLTRSIADCLEQHLPDHGFEPYRYPSGENKSVVYIDGGELMLRGIGQNVWLIDIRPLSYGGPT